MQNSSCSSPYAVVRRAAVVVTVLVASLGVLVAGLWVVPAIEARAAAVPRMTLAAVGTKSDLSGATRLQAATVTCDVLRAPEITGYQFRQAVWTEEEIPSGDLSTFFSDSARSGAHLKVASLECDEETGRVVVVPDTSGYSDSAKAEQERIELSVASTQEVEKHLALLYSDTSSTRRFQVRVDKTGMAKDDVIVDGPTYEAASGMTTFSVDPEDPKVFKALISVDVPRRLPNGGIKVDILKNGVTTAAKVTLDESTEQRTRQTFEVRAAASDPASTFFEVKTSIFIEVSVNWPTMSFNNVGSSYTMVGRVRAMTWTDLSGVPNERWHWCEEEKAVLASGLNGCAFRDYRWNDWSANATQNFDPGGGYTRKHTYITDLKDQSQSFPTDGSSTGVRAGYGRSVSFIVDGMKAVSDNTWRSDLYNQFLAEVTVNGQVFPVKFLRPCLLPEDVDKVESGDPSYSTKEVFCSLYNTWNWSGNSTYKRQAYVCMRAWMLGITRETGLDAQGNLVNACGFSQGWGSRFQGAAVVDEDSAYYRWQPDMDPTHTYHNDPFDTDTDVYGNPVAPKLQQVVTSGPLAGATVTVRLRNVRCDGDNAQLGYVNTYAENDGIANSDSGQQCTRWRTRYEIRIDNIPVPELHIGAQYEWNTHTRVFPGAGAGLSTNASGRPVIEAWGNLNQKGDEPAGTPAHWVPLCPDSTKSGEGCQYAWVELQPDYASSKGDRSKYTYTGRPLYRLQVKNGYGVPTVTAADPQPFVPEATVHPEIADDEDHYYFTTDRPLSVSFKYNKATSYVNGSATVYAEAEPLEFDSRYCATATTGCGDATVLNPASRYMLPVTYDVPDVGNKVFRGWDVLGVDESGEVVGTIATNVAPGTALDIRDFTFTDGDLAGKRALTSGAGERRIKEIRLVPNVTTASGTTSAPTVFPVYRTFTGANGGKDVEDVAFHYRAVAGLHAAIAAEALEDEAVTSATYNDVRYDLVEDDSTLGPVALTATVSKPALRLVYGLPGIPVTFSKKVTNDTGLTGTPKAEDFALSLTPKAGGDAITVSAGATPSDPIAPGDYTLTEAAVDSKNTELPKVWKPASGISCKQGENGPELVKDGVLSIPASGEGITCAADNQAAVVAIVTYDADAKAYLKASHNPRYTFGLEPTKDTDHAATVAEWHEAGPDTLKPRFATAKVDYRMTVKGKTVATYVTLQRYKNEVTNYATAASDTDASAWEDVTTASLTLPANKRTLMRVVLRTTRPQLPVTGGWGSEHVTLAGLGLLTLGGAAGLVLRRSRRARRS